MVERGGTGSEQVVRELTTFDYPRSDRVGKEADMVMKGGITSGVVYPLAVCELAKEYRFRNLGGTSAGGIAAAFAAAAECNRDGGGFNELARLPDALGAQLGDLFQPSRGTRPLYRILVAAIDSTRSGVGKKLRIGWAVVRSAWVAFLLGIAAGVLTTWLVGGIDPDGRELAPAVPLALLLGLAFVGVRLYFLARRALQDNGYGLCRGSNGRAWPAAEPGPGNAVEPFTDWMHHRLNRAAGKARGEVLAFGDLWGADAVGRYRAHRAAHPDDGPGAAMRQADPVLRLEMMTTNVTHCRPVRLPFESRVYLFCPTELADYFPPPVMTRLATGEPALDDGGNPWRCPDHGDELRHLPEPPDVPVVVAVRMTLSFPGLISAVPLHAVDYSRTVPKPVRCWFSDGGISSNFPIHFFDALWPRRPTFGISLAPYHPDHPDTDVYLPPPRARGRLPRVRGTDTLFGFAAAMLDTLQNWSDEGQSTLPGYRDRIVDIHHTEAEGGMNLTMSRPTIESLAVRGWKAGAALRTFDFQRHRWTRYLTAMSELDAAVRDIAAKYHGALPDGSPGYRVFVAAEAPEDRMYPRPAAWRADAVTRTDALLAFVGPSPDFTEDAPRPDPDLRVTAHF